jgi:hypothetical protein
LRIPPIKGAERLGKLVIVLKYPLLPIVKAAWKSLQSTKLLPPLS